MLHNTLDFGKRAQLSELMDEPCSRDVMRACLRDLSRVNQWFLAYRPLLGWINAIPRSSEPLRILDVGCGYGDSLRRIERWAHDNHTAVELTGLDLNPDTISIAQEAGGRLSSIRFLAADVFCYHPSNRPHLIYSSLFTHHLRDADVVRFLVWMEQNAQTGWFINDLSRAPIPYHLFRWFSRLARLHPFVQHDGPVSIARSFAPEDWCRLCHEAGLAPGDVEILSYMPARLCVSRRKHS